MGPYIKNPIHPVVSICVSNSLRVEVTALLKTNRKSCRRRLFTPSEATEETAVHTQCMWRVCVVYRDS